MAVSEVILLLAALNVGGVQQVVSLLLARSLEVLIIEQLHNRALVGFSEGISLVCAVQCRSSDSLIVNIVANAVACNRLTAAVDAAARASHYLNEVIILLAALYLLNNLSCISKT